MTATGSEMSGYLGPELTAEAAFLMDVSSGKVLYSKNADKPLFPASTTKIMTALLLLEYTELDEVVVVGEEINRIGPGSSTAKLKIGDRLTVAELVYALMLPSGNDAAYTTAVFVAKKVSGIEQMYIDQALEVFADMMNDRARELGALNTNFVVPDGYHTSAHVSTARDMALITQEAGKNQFIREVVKTPEYFWQGNRWGNTNRLLQQDYPQAYYPWGTGFKTGYTPQAGHCVVLTASGGGRDILGVILKSTSDQRWPDARKLLEYGFKSWRNYEMLVKGRQVFMAPVNGQRKGEPEMVKIVAGGTFVDLFHEQQVARIDLTFDWARGVVDTKETGLVLNTPIRSGQILGFAVISLDGKVLAEIELVAAHGVKGFNWWLPGGGAFAFIMILIFISRFRKKPGRQSSEPYR